jgi:hypothetical protein
MTDEKDVTEALKELRAAEASFREVDLAYREAGRNQTFALNHLREAQKAFDRAVDAVRSAAPRESDWKQHVPVHRDR